MKVKSIIYYNLFNSDICDYCENVNRKIFYSNYIYRIGEHINIIIDKIINGGYDYSIIDYHIQQLKEYEFEDWVNRFVNDNQDFSKFDICFLGSDVLGKLYLFFKNLEN